MKGTLIPVGWIGLLDSVRRDHSASPELSTFILGS
jgi:hypothetical protein